MRAETDEYQREMDVLANFIYERCVEGPGVTAISSQLFHAWEQWCRQNNEDPGTQTKFSGRMKTRGYKKEPGTAGAYKGKMVWHGIGIRDDDNDGGGGPAPDEPGPAPDPGQVLRVEPSTSGEPSTDPLHSEKGLDKPDSRGAEGECRGLGPKKGLTAELPTRICESTGKTLYTLYTLYTSDEEFGAAVDELKRESK